MGTKIKELLKLNHDANLISQSFGISEEKATVIKELLRRVSRENKISFSIERIWNVLESNNEKAYAIFLFGLERSHIAEINKLASVFGFLKIVAKIAGDGPETL